MGIGVTKLKSATLADKSVIKENIVSEKYRMRILVDVMQLATSHPGAQMVEWNYEGTTRGAIENLDSLFPCHNLLYMIIT